MSTATTHDEHHDHGPATGLMRWVTTTNHKDIGTLYLWLSFIMLLTGGAMAMVIRAELFQPGLQLVEPQFFNSMTTMPDHGLRCDHAGVCGSGQLVDSNADWRA